MSMGNQESAEPMEPKSTDTKSEEAQELDAQNKGLVWQTLPIDEDRQFPRWCKDTDISAEEWQNSLMVYTNRWYKLRRHSWTADGWKLRFVDYFNGASSPSQFCFVTQTGDIFKVLPRIFDEAPPVTGDYLRLELYLFHEETNQIDDDRAVIYVKRPRTLKKAPAARKKKAAVIDLPAPGEPNEADQPVAEPAEQPVAPSPTQPEEAKKKSKKSRPKRDKSPKRKTDPLPGTLTDPRDLEEDFLQILIDTFAEIKARYRRKAPQNVVLP